MVAETIMSTTARFQLLTIRAMKPKMRLHRERIEMTAGPTPGIDTTQAPRGVISARSLVDAVMASDDRVERHYLEAKSDLALTTKKDQAKLAKFILGAANRMPDKAAKAFEGYAVMVIGASADRCVGIPPIETLVIERAVLPYIGADGPKWDLLRVPVPNSQNEVLLLVVDPPQSGQGPFICHKEGDGLLDGAVYIRADGETRQAKADELKALIRRGESIAPSVDFEVAIKGDVVRATMDHEVALDDYIAAERQRLISALPAHRRPTHLHPDPVDARIVSTETLADLLTTANLAAAFGSSPETRTEEEYLGAIDTWEQSTRDAWPEAALRLVVLQLEPVEIRLTNRAQTFFHDVELKIHLEGAIQGVECEESEEELTIGDLGLPSPPREWGPAPFHFGIGLPNLAVPLASYRQPIPNRIQWHNTGSVDITFYVGDLRPMETDTCDDGAFALLLLGGTEDHVQGTWEITARGHHKVYTGELRAHIVDQDLTPELRQVLGLDD